MNMVTMASHNPQIPVIPMAMRTLLVCRTSRMTIIRVRKMLSEIEIDRYGISKSWKVRYNLAALMIELLPRQGLVTNYMPLSAS